MKNKYFVPLMMPFLLVSLFGCDEKPTSSSSSGDLSSSHSPTSNSTNPIVSHPDLSSPIVSTSDSTSPVQSVPYPSTPVISTPDPVPTDPKSVPLSHITPTLWISLWAKRRVIRFRI